MTKNWLNQLTENGYMIITTRDPEEALFFLNNSDIQKHVLVYGTTDALDLEARNNNYIIILQKKLVTQVPIRLVNAEHYAENNADPTLDDEDYTEAIRYWKQDDFPEIKDEFHEDLPKLGITRRT